jgi:two-component system sensor histidine kinase UhpB
MLGYTVEEMLGRRCTDFLVAVDRIQPDRLLAPATLSEPSAVDARLRRKDGSLLWALLNARPLHDPYGRHVGTIATVTDIPERKRAEEARAQLAAIVESSEDAIISESLDGIITSWNRAAERLFGYSSEEAIGRPSVMLAGSDRFAEVLGILERVRRRERVESFESQCLTRDGRGLDVSIAVSPIRHPASGISGASAIFRDISERKRREDLLRALAARVQTAREEEAARIAREIHDELGAALTGLRWDLEWVESHLPTEGGPGLSSVRGKVEDLVRLVDTILAAVRRISSDLRPAVLDDLGLVSAVEWRAAQFQSRTGIRVRFSSSTEKASLPRESETAVFRVLQEALTNILRHAHATEVEIRIEESGGELALDLVDNGRGIEPGAPLDTGTLGLIGMQERASLVGGSVAVGAASGGGTRVSVRVPLSEWLPSESAIPAKAVVR